MSATTQLEASLTGRVWNEFDGDNRAAIVTRADVLRHDKFDGAYGEVVGLLNVFNAGSGWSGFANLGVKFNGDFTTTTAKAGLRYVWVRPLRQRLPRWFLPCGTDGVARTLTLRAQRNAQGSTKRRRQGGRSPKGPASRFGGSRIQ